MFSVTTEPIDILVWRRRLDHPAVGAVVMFEGLVRNHHQGRAVRHLEYEGFVPLAVKTGAAILAEARQRWPITMALGCHRTGRLEIGEAAVWLGVAAAHRGEAFTACGWLMDAIKQRVPIWKREFFADGTVEWSVGNVMSGAPHG